MSTNDNLQPAKRRVGFTDLPNEVVAQILRSVDSSADRYHGSLVCKSWYYVLTPILFRRIAPRRFQALRKLVLNVSQATALSTRLHFSSLYSLIQVIDLSKVNIPDAEPSAYFEKLIMQTTQLEVLDLSNSLWLRDECLVGLVSCLNLRRLILHGCAQITGETLGIIVPQLRKLEEISLAHCTYIKNLSVILGQPPPALKSLNLNGLSPDVNAALRSVLRGCPELQNLSVEWSGSLTDWAFQDVEPPRSNLQRLSISRCNRLTSRALEYMAPHCRNLQELSLSGCEKITPTGIVHLIQFAPALVSLDIGFIDNLTDDHISTICVTLPKLQKLVISGFNTLVTDWSLLSISTHCPDLRHLNLNMNMNVTPSAVCQLVTRCVNMEKLFLFGCHHIVGSWMQQLARELDPDTAEDAVWFGTDGWRERLLAAAPS
ncbi:hypothetical protein HDU85_000418 [Gaertneriomyces sp. JEL0708]|nr:hypothetical protein HDU85_000418 [Gaertneriomyces sp. JEL0708]